MADLEIKEGQWLWMEHETEVWIPVKPVANYGDSVSCEGKDGTAYTIKVTEDKKLRHVQPSSMEALDDMINLHELFDGAILNTLRDRYNQNKIYTNISSIVIAVNPYKQLPLFTREVQQAYHSKDMEDPHVYILADNAYAQMVTNKMPQALIVSGESGSGKTETTKIILRYFSFLSGKGSDIEKKIVDANPIVEAFGNAQTLRNHNSSRFGKFIEIHFDKGNAILGANVKSFLLEVARISGQLEGERNFHFFYQMCAGLVGDATYALKPAEQMAYCMGGGTTKIEGMDDKVEWDTTLAAMKTLNFLDEDQKDIFAIVAAVLHLGNITFDPIEKGEKSKITDVGLEALKHVARLLAIPEEKLQECMLQRTQKFSKFEAAVTMFFKPLAAAAARDSLARLLYSKVFDFVIDYCNLSMEVKDEFLKGGGMIGVLDIFGFECFKENKFEQLCINYTNEKLQQHFNKHVFVLEQEAYALEDVSVEAVNFADNQECIDLIEKAPSGILPMLDEELVLPDGTDAHFAHRLKDAHKNNKYFGQHKVKVANQFMVVHYAGSVPYNVDGFMEKNKNEVPADLAALAAMSTVCNRKIIPVEVEEKSVMGKATKKKTSIGTQFKNNLKALMDTLDKSFPHFIRCIKPNSIQGPDKYDAPLVNEQLRYSGVQAVVAIRQQGYPFRIHHTRFYHRYKICSLDRAEEAIMNGLDGSKHRPTVTKFCERLPNVENEWAVGKTKVLIKAVAQEKLENLRKFKITHGIAKVQGIIKRQDAVARVAQLKESNLHLVLCMKAKDMNGLAVAIAEAQDAGLDNHNLPKAKVALERLKLEKGLTDRLESMMAQAQFDEAAAQKLLAECNKYNLEHPIFNKFKIRIVHEKINVKLRAAIASQKVDQLTAAIDEAVANGLDPEDEVNCPFTVQAFRLRLRLTTQGQVEDKLREATESTNRAKIRAAMKLAHNIDLPPSVASYAALIEIHDQLAASEAALAAAVKNRDLAALMLALQSEKELGQHEEEAVISATNLLASLQALDAQLKSALIAADFNQVMEAVDAAERAQIKCASLDQAKVFSRTHVEVSLKSALKSAVLPGADWETILNTSIRQAKLLDMMETDIAKDAVALLSKLQVVQSVRDAIEAKDLDQLAIALDHAEQLGLGKEFDEIVTAGNFLKATRKTIVQLQRAVERRHPEELAAAVAQANKINMSPSDSNLVTATSLLEKLSKIVDALNAAVAAGAKPALYAALESAEKAELTWEDAAFAKARNLSQNLSSTEEKLQAAIKNRRMEELEVAIASAGGLNSPLAFEAQQLLATIRTFDEHLKVAVASGEFRNIVTAIHEAETASIMCATLSSAHKWAEEHVKTALKSAIKKSQGSGQEFGDAIPLLEAAIEKAHQIEIPTTDEEEILARLTIRYGLQQAIKLQNENHITEFLTQAEEISLQATEVDAARAFLNSVGSSRSELISAIKGRNPDVLTTAIQAAIKCGCDPSDAILQQAQDVRNKLLAICEAMDIPNKKGDLAKLEKSILAAHDASLSTGTEAYVRATDRVVALKRYYATLNSAVTSRVYEDLESCLTEANSLGLSLQPDVIDAQGLYVKLGKVHATLTEAISSGDISQMDAAIKVARESGIQGKSFQQAVLRVSAEAKFALQTHIERAVKEKDKPERDTSALLQALHRIRDLHIKDWKLTMKAAALLYRSKDQEKAINVLKDAVANKDEQALDKALALAHEVNLPAYVPAMAAALDYKKQLQETRANLQKASASRDMDLLAAAIKSAEELGIDKNLDAWKVAKTLEPTLQGIVSDIRSALTQGKLDQLKSALARSVEMKMAEHTSVLVEANNYMREVSEFYKETQNAVKARKFSDLQAVMFKAEKLKRTEDIEVVSATAMYNKQKKLDEQLRAALKNPDDHKLLDDAIIAARDAQVDLTSYKQALIRAEEEIRLELNILLRKDNKKAKDVVHSELRAALDRAQRLGTAHENEIYERAKERLELMDKTKHTDDMLREAFLAKNEKGIREWMAKAELLDKDKDLYQECQEYLDRLPTHHGASEEDEIDDVRRPLQFYRKTGNMEKRAQKFPYNWKSRFFVLENTVLKYYEEDPSTGINHPRGSVVVAEVAPPKHSHHKHKDWGFRCGGNRKIDISCTSKAEKDLWLKVLHCNLRVQARMDRIKACFEAVTTGEANIYQLGVITKLVYLPDDTQLENMQQELNLRYRDGQATLKEVMEVCRNWQPEGKEWEDEGFEKACLDYLDQLTGGTDQSINAAARLKELRGRKTHSPDQLLHFACTVFCPDKSVVDRVTTFFRKSHKSLTFYHFVSGLQDTSNGSLPHQLRLQTDIPALKDIQAERTEGSAAGGSMSLAVAQASKTVRGRSFIGRQLSGGTHAKDTVTEAKGAGRTGRALAPGKK